MPSLTWPGKQLSTPQPSRLVQDSIIFPQGSGYPDAPARDRLVLGDNAGVMASLLTELEGRFNLIYVDPPFFTNRSYPARIGRGEDSRRPEEWALAEGYADHWSDLDAYLAFLYPRLGLMHRLLAASGTLYVHLDWHASAYARLLLDELFGADHLLNEIVWTYHGPSPIRRAFNRKHDTILAYFKGPEYTFNADDVRQPYNPATVQTFKASPKAGFGKVPDLARGKVPEDWWYFPVVARLHKERTGYPTQKPQALMERIVLASSNPGDLVGDFFCGSGTTAVVAAQLGRRYVAVDSSHRAIHTTRRRLCAVPCSPFLIEREPSIPLPVDDGVALDLHRADPGLRLECNRAVDYWEVDPEWDGAVFRSAAQLQRPNGSGEIPLELRIKTGRRVCVRLVTAQGNLVQSVLGV